MNSQTFKKGKGRDKKSLSFSKGLSEIIYDLLEHCLRNNPLLFDHRENFLIHLSLI